MSTLVGPSDGRVPRLLNRELSWLDFNERVLALAEDDSLPLLERVKFCAIFSSNLDEFFQVRVAALKDQVAAGVSPLSPDGRTAGQQLLEIGDRVDELLRHQEDLLLDVLLPALATHGITVCRWSELELDERKHLDEVFDERVFPVLTPLGVDPAHPFPYISNLSLNLAVLVYDAQNDRERFARVKVPPTLPRFVALPDGERFVLLEDLIAAHLDSLFPGMTVVDHWMFRVTRNADLTVEEEEADDLLAALEMELRRRRFGRAVRLEMEAGTPKKVLDLLTSELDMTEDDISFHRGPLDLTGLWALHRLDRPELKDEPWVPMTPALLADAYQEGRSLFDVLREQDVLVHHPYDSFKTTVEELIRQAADDPDVLSIKVTLYRTSGDSAIAQDLIRAAERGVQVAVLVELKARFDEQRNITWAKRFEEAGVHVVHGVVGLKTHSKCTLVVRDEPDGLRRYAHVGTGNYNSSTARLYEDLGLLTCDPQIGSDLSQLFNNLTGFSREDPYRRLVVAPRSLRPKFLDLIAKETALGSAGRIIMKMNSLVDPELIEALYAASRAGVRVDLVIRGICCLLPGVPGLSDHIRVRSILGRYLEHSRVYVFGNGNGPGRPVYYIGSADLMPRNLDKRVEVLAPVAGPEHQQRLDAILSALLADHTRGWELGADARWRRVGPDSGDAQAYLYEMARQPRAPGPRSVTGGATDKTTSANGPVPHEREAKVSVWPGFEVPDLQASVPWIVTGSRALQVLDARYVDAADLRLLRMGITFRHRTGEGPPEGRWTLKLPVPSEGLALDRLEMEHDGPPGPPPAHMAAVVRGVLRGAPLVPVAHLQTQRTVVPITDPAQRPLGVLSDDVVSAFEGDQVGLRFREIEVEAAGGAPDSVLAAVVAALRSAGAGEADHVPKLARALGPRALAPADPDVPAITKAGATGATTADVFRATVAAAVRRLLLHDPIVRLDAGDEGVHQARVATRRLRSDLRTFRTLLEADRIAPLVEELRWLGGVLGAVRDADVLGERLAEAVEGLDEEDRDAGGALLDRLARQREPLLAALHEALDSDRYLALADALVELALRPPLLVEAGQPAVAAMRELVAEPWDHLARRVRRLEKHPADEELHRVRILAKRARYAAEAASVVIPAAGRHAAAIASLQGVLGDHQDAVVAEAWLRRVVAEGASGREGLAAGLLVSAEWALAAQHRKRWRKAWKAANRRKLRSWLAAG